MARHIEFESYPVECFFCQKRSADLKVAEAAGWDWFTGFNNRTTYACRRCLSAKRVAFGLLRSRAHAAPPTRGNVLERFISSQVMADYVVAELAQNCKNPICLPLPEMENVMSDRELLEVAAKAAGLHIDPTKMAGAEQAVRQERERPKTALDFFIEDVETAVCDRCNGSGDQAYLVGGGPDAHDEIGPCSVCQGTGAAVHSVNDAPATIEASSCDRIMSDAVLLRTVARSASNLSDEARAQLLAISERV